MGYIEPVEVKVGAYVVRKYNILTTDVFVFEVLEPYDGHSSIHHVDGVRYGRVGTAKLPEYMQLLSGELRYSTVRAWQSGQYERAYQIIGATFPEAANGRRDMGAIELVERPAEKVPA